jgi:hypothetical protein
MGNGDFARFGVHGNDVALELVVLGRRTAGDCDYGGADKLGECSQPVAKSRSGSMHAGGSLTRLGLRYRAATAEELIKSRKTARK